MPIFIRWQMKNTITKSWPQFEPMVWILDIIRNFSFWVKSVRPYGFTNIAWSTKTNITTWLPLDEASQTLWRLFFVLRFVSDDG